jgi:hypothetical protein
MNFRSSIVWNEIVYGELEGIKNICALFQGSVPAFSWRD